jgi:hypothetical protein
LPIRPRKAQNRGSMEGAKTTGGARRVLIVLVVLAGAVLALSIVQRDRALQDQYEQAQDRAELYAATVIRSALAPRDVGSLSDAAYSALQADVQGSVLTEPAVARVRLWTPEGALFFSTDTAERRGGTSEDEAIGSAARGVVLSRLAVEPLTPPATEGSGRPTTPLFQTFAPLVVRDSTTAVGAVEVEQLAAVLEDRADDPWWLVQSVAAGVTVALAVIALFAVARGMRRPATAPASGSGGEGNRRRRGKRDEGGDAATADLRERLSLATERADAAEAEANASSAKLKEVSGRLEAIEGRSTDEVVAELQEALRRSEAERAMLRSGRPETLQEAEVRGLRRELLEAQALARAAQATARGNGDVAEIKEQLVAAAEQVDRAVERAKVAEGRADAAEDRMRAAGDMVSAAEQRIDGLEATLQDLAETGVTVVAGVEVEELRRELATTRSQAEDAERRAAEAQHELATGGSPDGPSEEILSSLEERVAAAEALASDAEARVRSYEDELDEEGSSYRHRIGVAAAGRKLAAPSPAEDALAEPELDLRAAIARGLRAPLTRAAGLTLSFQGSIQTPEGKAALRQLSSSLRRLDQHAADLYGVQAIVDGTMSLNPRRTDLAALLATTVDEASNLEDRLVRSDVDSVTVLVDPARARQIVEGMLDASKERTRNGAAIVVRLREIDTGGLVTVEDDSRIPATIGPELVLAVRLAELMGTELTVDGSSFRVVFPRGES